MSHNDHQEDNTNDHLISYGSAKRSRHFDIVSTVQRPRIKEAEIVNVGTQCNEADFTKDQFLQNFLQHRASPGRWQLKNTERKAPSQVIAKASSPTQRTSNSEWSIQSNLFTV
jgi:hypothetical protein